MAKENKNTNVSSNTSTAKSGRKSYSSVKLHAREDKRRLEADGRQLRYDKLTVKEKVALAKSRRGESKRELARLSK